MEYVCLNRGTTGGNLSQEDFVKVAAGAGFAGADVDINYGVQHGVAKLADLYATHHLRFGGWGAPDFRAESAKLPEGLAQLKKWLRWRPNSRPIPAPPGSCLLPICLFWKTGIFMYPESNPLPIFCATTAFGSDWNLWHRIICGASSSMNLFLLPD